MEPIGLESRDVVSEPGSKFEDQFGISQVWIRPDLRHPAPVLGPAKEAADHRLLAKLSPPPPLRSEQAGDHRLVVRFVRVLDVEADLKREGSRLGCVLAPDDLCLIVLARRLVLAKPDLDAGAVALAAQVAKLVRD